MSARTVTAHSLIARYLVEASECLRGVSPDEIAGVLAALRDTVDRDAQILVAGNGGSSAIASHLASDLAKSTLDRNGAARRRIRALSLTDNIPLMTAWANDVRYEVIFSEQLRTLARPGDALLVISGSGNSPNILAALEAARENGVRRLGMLGFDGGQAKALVDDCVHVRSSDYGHVEIAHSTIAHLITDRLAKHIAR